MATMDFKVFVAGRATEVVDGTEEMPLVPVGGVTKKVTVDDLLARGVLTDNVRYPNGQALGIETYAAIPIPNSLAYPDGSPLMFTYSGNIYLCYPSSFNALADDNGNLFYGSGLPLALAAGDLYARGPIWDIGNFTGNSGDVLTSGVTSVAWAPPYVAPLLYANSAPITDLGSNLLDAFGLQVADALGSHYTGSLLLDSSLTNGVTGDVLLPGTPTLWGPPEYYDGSPITDHGPNLLYPVTGDRFADYLGNLWYNGGSYKLADNLGNLWIGTGLYDGTHTLGASGQFLSTNGTLGIWRALATGDLANNLVTYAKLQDVASLSLLGNPTGGATDASEITLGAGLSFSGSTLVNTIFNVENANLVFAGPATGIAATPTFRALETADLATGIVTYAKIQTVAAASLLGNPTGGVLAASEITLGAGLAFTGTTLVNTFTPLALPVAPGSGGTGVANNAANLVTFTGAFSLGVTLTADTTVTLPTTGTLAALGNANVWTGQQTFNTSAAVFGVGVLLPLAAAAVIYNTADQVTNFEKATMAFSSNVLTIACTAGGTGTVRTTQIACSASTFTVATAAHPLFAFNIGVRGIPSALKGFLDFTGTFTGTTTTQIGISVTPTISQSGSAGYTLHMVNAVTGTGTGSGTKLLYDGQVAGVSKFSVDSTGTITCASIVSTAAAAATVGIISKAAASRTAQLQQFQTSAGGSLGNVSGGCVGDVFATVSTTSTGGAFDTLRTDTLVANALIVNGDKIFFDYTLTVVSSATATRDFKLAFAGITIFDSGALTFAATGTVRISGYIIRKTSTTCRATINFAPSGSAAILGFASTNYVTDGTLTGLTLTGTNSLVLSAAAAGTGAASADIALVQGTIHIDGFGS